MDAPVLTGSTRPMPWHTMLSIREPKLSSLVVMTYGPPIPRAPALTDGCFTCHGILCFQSAKADSIIRLGESGDKWGAAFSGDRWERHLTMSIINPDSRKNKPVLTPCEFDLMNDKFAPRAFADYTRDLSSTFQQCSSGGSYTGSPPRTRDKFGAGVVPHFRNSPSPTKKHFLHRDPWESH